MVKKGLSIVWSIVCWIIGLFFVLFGVASFGNGVMGAVTAILFGLFVTPIKNMLYKAIGFRLKRGINVLITILLFFAMVFTSGTSENSTSTEVVEETITLDENNWTPLSTLDVSSDENIATKKPITNGDTVASEPKKEEIPNNTSIEVEKIVSQEPKPASPVEDVVPAPQESNLSVHFLNVGQADATLLVCDGEALLLDAGDTSKGTAVQLYLNKQGVNSLKYLILTHPDEDHIGGADVVITKYPVENVFMSDYKKDTKSYEEVINALDYRRVKWSTPTVGSTYSLGAATFTILAPNRTYDDPNEASIALLVSHGENTFLFTGDGESGAEGDILRSGLSIDCDVFKAGHHGSKTSNSKSFLEKASPEYVVVSCGVGNSYGHPHAEPMNNFRSMGMKLFRTDEQGTIIAYSDLNTLTWNMSPTDSWVAGEPTQSSTEKTSTPQVSTVVSAPVQEPIQNPEPMPAPEPEPAPVIQQEVVEEAPVQQTGGSFAVNNRNGKIHMVGECNATEIGNKNAMKEPIYFNTYEEAEAYSKQTHPELEKVKCGNCW